ncbi:MAG: DUF58 domain-containing protein [Chloroflexi bacterium]|nr:DUF58 domain-containing protein [Chloroflexota bacterium]
MDSFPSSRIHLQARLLPPICILLLILQIVSPFRGWMILLTALSGLWLLSWLWTRALARGLKLTREMRFGWAQVGDRIEERFTLANSSLLPALWVEVIDHSTMPNYRASQATGVEERAEHRWSVWGVCSRRGTFALGPTTLVSGDPFGIYTVSFDYPTASTMIVMPPIVPLANIQIAPGRSIGEGNRRVETWERTVTASGIRDYVPGDSLQSIHWRSTAHRNELSVRLFDSTPTSDWWIFLDLEKRAQAGQDQESTLEHGIILAASLADHGLRLGRAVGLVASGENSIWIPPNPGMQQRWQILRELARVSAGTHSMQNLLERFQSSLKQRTSLIVITPAADGKWIASLTSYRRRGIVPTILLLDPLSFGGMKDAGCTLALLDELEFAHQLITRDLLDRPEAKPGHEGYWEWHASPLGKAVPVHTPRDSAWKQLS